MIIIWITIGIIFVLFLLIDIAVISVGRVTEKKAVHETTTKRNSE